MRLSRAVIDRYVKSLTGIRSAAAEQLRRGLAAIDMDGPNAYQQVLALMRQVNLGSNALAGQYTAAFYDAMRKAQTGSELGAVAFDAYDETKTARAAGAAVNAGRERGREAAADVLMSRIGFDIKNTSSITMFGNGKRDRLKPRFARVPSGVETCSFCIMLASRGFVYYNGKNGEKVHNHDNCRCVYVPGFNVDMKVEGYDPDSYYDMYRNPDKYPELKEARNARRREIYAERKQAQPIAEEQLSAPTLPDGFKSGTNKNGMQYVEYNGHRAIYGSGKGYTGATMDEAIDLLRQRYSR